MDLVCRRISAEESRPLRALVLRNGRPAETARYPQEGESVHFGGFLGGRLVTCVAAHPEDRAPFPGKGHWRIRGMATDFACQGKGYGGLVLAALLAWGRAEGIRLWWCNAREKAIPFYLRHGFTVESELFDIAGIGPHKVMKLEA